MPAPERRDPAETQASLTLSPAERRRMLRAAALRPINLVVIAVGAAFFALTLAWWLPPLTLLTYAALVFLGARDPIFQQRILGRSALPAGISRTDDVSPERRARWLPRGETRETVEAALVAYRGVVSDIEGSDDVTREVLGDTLPRLHAVANRLVDVARNREKAAEAARNLGRDGNPSETRSENLKDLQDLVDASDAEISETAERLADLRAKVVRASIDTGNVDRKESLNASLDELNARLEALADLSSPREG